MILTDVLAAVRRYRERVRTQSQLARDIQHLGEVARMLFEDKPDKTKAVDAVNDIATKRMARMDAEARALLESVPPNAACSGFHDRGDLVSWLMLVNHPGRFPYTQGIIEPGASPDGATATASRSRSPGNARAKTGRVQRDPAPHLSAALAEGWARLAAAKRDAAGSLDAGALPIAIEFNEYRDARHRALARAARRLWAVSLREHFGIDGECLKLVIIPCGPADANDSLDIEISNRVTDQAEDSLLEALQRLVRSAPRD